MRWPKGEGRVQCCESDRKCDECIRTFCNVSIIIIIIISCIGLVDILGIFRGQWFKVRGQFHKWVGFSPNMSSSILFKTSLIATVLPCLTCRVYVWEVA